MSQCKATAKRTTKRCLRRAGSSGYCHLHRRAHQPAVTAEEVEQALQLRIAGGTYREIGRAMGCSHQTAYRTVQLGLAESRERRAELAEEITEAELERLDALQARAWAVLEHPEAAITERLKAVSTALRVSESRRKLLGLDAPDKIEHAGEVVWIPDFGEEGDVGVLSDGDSDSGD